MADRKSEDKATVTHPFGVGAGAAGGGAAGAAIGAAAGGPVGAVVGAAVGAVAGGLGGKAVAEVANPALEESYWRTEHLNRAYSRGEPYDWWQEAYRYGWESRLMHGGSTFAELEPQLEAGWPQARGTSGLEWDRAREAVRAAFERMPGPKDGAAEH